jgi:serine/threonine protein kinase
MKDIGRTFLLMVLNDYNDIKIKTHIKIILARSFIRKCLSLNPDTRPTATEALNDIWMTGRQAKDIDILNTVRENFNARRTFKSAISAVKAMNRIRAHSMSRVANDENKRAATSVVAPTSQAISSLNIGTDVGRVKSV